MKNVYLFLFVLLAGCGVKEKVIENTQQSVLMAAITNGQWKVTGFLKGSNDITAAFANYKFQFKDNYTVDAINYGTVENTGTWSAAGDVQAQTITSNFPNAADPLVNFNCTWNILSTTWTSVHASQTVNGELRDLKLEKL